MSSQIKVWIQAARLRTLPLAAACVLVASAFALKEGVFRWEVFILTLLTTFFLQVLSNFANDYGDSENGADNVDRVGPQRAVQSGSIPAKSMFKAMVLLSILSLISGSSLIYIAFESSGFKVESLIFFILGLGAIAAAIKYTAGKNPYGYSGFGDLSVFLFFGFLGVMGAFYMHGNHIDFSLVSPALCIGSLSTAVLNLNNLRDHRGDALAGKRTVVVRLGFERGKAYHLVLIVLAGISGFVTVHLISRMAVFSLVALIIPILQLRKVYASVDGSDLDSELKKTALSTFLFSFMLFIFSWWS